MEKYIIFYNETSTSKEYVSYIYRNSISHSKDMGDAIEFFDKDTAVKVRDFLGKRDGTTKYKVLCVETKYEEVE